MIYLNPKIYSDIWIYSYFTLIQILNLQFKKIYILSFFNFFVNGVHTIGLIYYLSTKIWSPSPYVFTDTKYLYNNYTCIHQETPKPWLLLTFLKHFLIFASKIRLLDLPLKSKIVFGDSNFVPSCLKLIGAEFYSNRIMKTRARILLIIPESVKIYHFFPILYKSCNLKNSFLKIKQIFKFYGMLSLKY